MTAITPQVVVDVRKVLRKTTKLENREKIKVTGFKVNSEQKNGLLFEDSRQPTVQRQSTKKKNLDCELNKMRQLYFKSKRTITNKSICNNFFVPESHSKEEK